MIEILAVSPKLILRILNGFFYLEVRYENLNRSFFHFKHFNYLLSKFLFRESVVDAETNFPLANANVNYLSKVGIGTTTDENGEFNLTVDVKYTDTI